MCKYLINERTGPVENMNTTVALQNSLPIECFKYTEVNDKNQQNGSKRSI